MTSPADDNLKYLSASAQQYQVPDSIIDLVSGTLEPMDQPRRGLSEVDALIDAVQVVADKHAGPHEDGCDTCDGIRNGLSVALGIVRAEANLTFAKMIGE